ncbi:MAG: SGNH/GDSL hydrolase family protein [Spirosomataceae bacterium]
MKLPFPFSFVAATTSLFAQQPEAQVQAMLPFWKGKTMHGESVMMISKEGQPAEAALLFKPKRILSVKDAGQTVTYKEGLDWEYKDGKLRLLPGSGAVFMKETELFPDSARRSFPKRGGGKILFEEGAFFHSKQLSVSYKHARNAWKGLVPVVQKDNLTVSLDRLTHKKPIHILLFGDSIAAGYNASGKSNAAPYLPDWGTLIAETLKQHYQTDIRFTNTSVGGKNSEWGKQTVQQNVVAYNPDLVIIAFGMNDGTGKVSAEKFRENIREIMQRTKDRNPAAEFILVSPMLPNPASLFVGTQTEFTKVLQELTGKGSVLVDMTDVHRELLQHKSYQDLTGNHINHPNDFLIRWYAQEIVGMLMP